MIRMIPLLEILAVAAIAAAIPFWISRLRARRRWHTALNAFAQLQIEHEPRRRTQRNWRLPPEYAAIMSGADSPSAIRRFVANGPGMVRVGESTTHAT
jgi:hypothetical protein